MIENLPHDLLGNGIRLMLGAGMRTQELLALEPEFIAEDSSVISIRQAVNPIKGTVSVGPPKSRDSYRDIPVPPPLPPRALPIRETDKSISGKSASKISPATLPTSAKSSEKH